MILLPLILSIFWSNNVDAFFRSGVTCPQNWFWDSCDCSSECETWKCACEEAFEDSCGCEYDPCMLNLDVCSCAEAGNCAWGYYNADTCNSGLSTHPRDYCAPQECEDAETACECGAIEGCGWSEGWRGGECESGGSVTCDDCPTMDSCLAIPTETPTRYPTKSISSEDYETNLIYENSLTTCDGTGTEWGTYGLEDPMSLEDCEKWCGSDDACNFIQYQPSRPMCHLYMDCDVTREAIYAEHPGDTYEFIMYPPKESALAQGSDDGPLPAAEKSFFSQQLSQLNLSMDNVINLFAFIGLATIAYGIYYSCNTQSKTWTEIKTAESDI